MAEERKLNSEQRYRYIGFEVYPKKVRAFWRDDDERKSYITSVKEHFGSVFRNSVVYSEVISATDRVLIALASVIMIVAPFLTWMSADTRYGTVKFNGLTGFLNLDGFWFYVELLDGLIIPLTVYLTTALAYLSLFFGAVTLIFLFMKAKEQTTYLKRLKSVMRLQLIPFLIFLLIVLLGLIGQRIPFGQHLGVYGLGSRFSIVTFVAFSSLGLWLSVFGFILNFNKSKDL